MKFTEEHEWLRSEGDEVVVGITIPPRGGTVGGCCLRGIAGRGHYRQQRR